MFKVTTETLEKGVKYVINVVPVLLLLTLLLTYFKPFSTVSIVDLEQVYVSWVLLDESIAFNPFYATGLYLHPLKIPGNHRLQGGYSERSLVRNGMS